MREFCLLNFNGNKYGVWKDHVISIKALENVHQLPLTPACFAGVSDFDDRTVALFDLGVCIGFPPINRKQPIHLLLMSEKDRFAGLVVAGVIKHVSIPSDSVFPMPNYLKTLAIDTCALHEGDIVPIINISNIYSSRLKGELEPFMSKLDVSGTALAEELSSIKDVRILRTNGETFAVSASCIREVSTGPESIFRLKFTPTYVKGIVFHKDKIIPVISLSKYLKLPCNEEQEMMIVVDLGGEKFGFTVDSDEAILSDEDFTVSPLPPLVRFEWMKSAVLRKGEIIPLINFSALVSGHQDEMPLPERYRPASRFSSLFGKKQVVIREFLLLGMRHGLPNSQVESVIDLLPYRRLPDAPPVVAGAAEHKGELLPVLDLAVWFGASSNLKPGWKMILVKNGNFRALVLTEAVFQKRSLPREMHRTIPFALPYQYVYGCYPVDNVVRIILNLAAMSVHFDKSAVMDLSSIMSIWGDEVPEMVIQTPPVPEAWEEFVIRQADTIQDKTEDTRQEFEKPAEAKGQIQEVDAAEPAHQEPHTPEQERISEEQSADLAARNTGDDNQAMEDVVSEAIPDDVTEKQMPVDDPDEGDETAARPPDEYPDVTSTPRRRRDLFYSAIATVLIAVLFFFGVLLFKEPGSGVGKSVKKKPPETAVKDKAPSLIVPFAKDQKIEPAKPLKPMEPEPDIVAPARKAPPEMTEEHTIASVTIPHEQNQSIEPIKLAKSLVPKSDIVAASRKTPPEIAEEHKIASVTIPPAQDKAIEPIKLVKTHRYVSGISNIYEVKKGDTLWDISESYTGDPFNYSMIASDNEIKNPHFILPGQRILLNPVGDAQNRILQ
jgi:chemotaxis signal transduction protein/nucleoid-associated protein YgaU